MLKSPRISKEHMYMITHNVGLRNNLHVHHQHATDTAALQQKSVNMLSSILVN